ncbi:MAG: GNAT family N-acetyltransferase [Candidatus Acidiferrales bacterium]
MNPEFAPPIRDGVSEIRNSGASVENPIDCNTDWFDRCLAVAREDVELLVRGESGRAQIVHFEIAKRLLFCQLGDLVLARLPMRVGRLSLCESQVRDEESQHDRIFAEVLSRPFDAIHIESVRPDTHLWHYLQSSRLIQNSFRLYSQRGLLPHWLIRLAGSFSDYTKQLSAKTRKNRLRETRLLRNVGDVKLIRVTETSEIDAFLEAAYVISRKTRQFQQFGWSVAARDRQLVKAELARLAQHGWLRCYFLMCGSVPCSFILGQQAGSRFYPVAAGVDPGWERYSVGTVLLWLALEDLFGQNSPEFYDLGTSAKHKEYLATDSYLEADVWLFRRRPYPALASSICRVCDVASRVGGAALARIGLKRKVAHFLGPC